MKKIIWPGIIAGLCALILGMAVSYLFMLFPSVAQDYNSPGLMRPWSDPLMTLFLLSPFIQGLILSWAWDKSKGLFSGSQFNKGIKFGLAIFVIATIPGMFISYTSFPISLLTIISWTVSSLITCTVMGIIFARTNKA